MTVHTVSLFKWISLFSVSSFLVVGCNIFNYQAHAPHVVQRFQITDEKVSEASGLAVSRRDEGILWINNDGGNPNTIYAVNTQGELKGSVKLKGAINRDWEDVASFTHNGKPYLLVADVGDNDQQWPTYTLYIVAEPVLDDSGYSQHEIEPEWRIEFSYPDGQHDCESVAVDVQRQKIMLLTKREAKPKLFELPLFATGNVVATDLGEIYPIPDAQYRGLSIADLLSFATMPTAMDISADGQRLVVLTYEGVYFYANKTGSKWQDILAQPPTEIPLPNLMQAEAIGFDPSGEYVYVTTERLPAPLYKLQVSLQ